MNDSEKALLIMSVMSVIFDALDDRTVDLSDFDEAVEKVGFDSTVFRNAHPFAMIYLLAQELVDIKLTSELLEGMVSDE
ncbi:hypothetical protein ACPA0F_18420 [Solibacillus silvestris]